MIPRRTLPPRISTVHRPKTEERSLKQGEHLAGLLGHQRRVRGAPAEDRREVIETLRNLGDDDLLDRGVHRPKTEERSLKLLRARSTTLSLSAGAPAEDRREVIETGFS